MRDRLTARQPASASRAAEVGVVAASLREQLVTTAEWLAQAHAQVEWAMEQAGQAG
jgi:hypothetical protein